MATDPDTANSDKAPRSVSSLRNRSLLRILLLCSGPVVLYGCAAPNPDLGALAPEQIDYNWDVRPILSENCFRCHGPDAASREAGLRLDLRDFAMAELP